MNGKRFIFFIVILSLTIMTACSSKQAATNQEQENVPAKTTSESPESTLADTQEIIYSNVDAGITVYETDGWALEKETKTDKAEIATFRNEKVKAILTILSTDKSFDDIKSELKVGAGKVEIIGESDGYVAFKSLRKESMRTDIYLNKSKDGQVSIFTFVTPNEQFSSNQGKIEAILNHVNRN